MTAPKPHQQPARTLPRRANTIRSLSAAMAARKMVETNLRQSVSDRVGYAVAVVVGSVAHQYIGKIGVAVIAGLYLVNAFFAHRKWKKGEEALAKIAKP